MKSFLVVGIGRYGKHVAMKLHELGHEVMAVDVNENCINEVLPYVTNSLIGDATNPLFVQSLGVRNFDVCIVAIADNFQSSLEVTSLLKENGAKMVVSRTSRDVQAKFLLRCGADHVVYPEKQLANWVAIRYSSENILDYIELDQDFAVFEVSIPEKWEGHSVGELNVRKKFGINIMAVKRDGRMDMNINADTRFFLSDSILVLGKIKDIQKCFRIS